MKPSHLRLPLGWLLPSLFFPLLLISCRQRFSDPAETFATATPIAVHRYENEVAFDLFYPSEWTYLVISEGLLMFGEPQTVLSQEAGASLTIFRPRISETQGGLEETFQHYLESGPLQTGYVTTTEVEATTLGGREALQVSVEKEGAGDQPAMAAYIIGAQTESDSIYLMTATVPRNRWQEQWPTFQVIIGSVKFNE